MRALLDIVADAIDDGLLVTFDQSTELAVLECVEMIALVEVIAELEINALDDIVADAILVGWLETPDLSTDAVTFALAIVEGLLVTPLQSTDDDNKALDETVALAILDGLLDTPAQSTEADIVALAILVG